MLHYIIYILFIQIVIFFNFQPFSFLYGNNFRDILEIVSFLTFLFNILLPSSDEPKASKADVSYAASCFLNIIVTPLVNVSFPARRLSTSFSSNEIVNMAPLGFVQRVLPRKSDNARFSPSIYKAAYLGKVLILFIYPTNVSTLV